MLAAKGCMNAGVGKLTCLIPSCGYEIMQSTIPEAMCKISGERFINENIDIFGYDAVGIGPGIGLQKGSAIVLHEIFLSANKQMLCMLLTHQKMRH